MSLWDWLFGRREKADKNQQISETQEHWRRVYSPSELQHNLGMRALSEEELLEVQLENLKRARNMPVDHRGMENSVRYEKVPNSPPPPER